MPLGLPFLALKLSLLISFTVATPCPNLRAFPNTYMSSLHPAITITLNQIANISDSLASTFCNQHNFASEEMTACLNNLDSVASALTLEELNDAPAKLMSSARLFREAFPSDALGWDDAATLQNAAFLIASHLSV